MIRRSIALLLFVVSVLPFLQSCEQTCDILPAQQPASLRIVNAMAGVDTLLIYIDSTLFDRAYYDLTDPNLYPQTVEGRFGYHSTYRTTGAHLRPGSHHIVAYAPTRPTQPIVDTTLSFTQNRQTLIFMGKQGSVATPAKAMYLDDNTRARDDNRSLARFVHTVTDLDSLDIYFSSTAKLDQNGQPKPDLRIGYGQISDENGTGHGTGKSPTDYFSVPLTGTGLLITASHDPTNIIFTTEYGFNSRGFFSTVVVRGETKPVGSEPVVSSTVLADEPPGTFAFSTTTFGVRLTNATRDNRMSLAVKGNFDAGPRDGISLQDYVKWIPNGSTSRYWPLTPLYHGAADYFLSTADSGVSIIDSGRGFYPVPFHFVSVVNKRYTLIAVDSTPLGAGIARYGIVRLLDTMSLVGPGKTRVRFVNTSPDHIANFTFEGKPFVLHQGEIGFADAALGTYSITISDGSSSKTAQFTLDSEAPMTVFILPARSTNAFPVSTAHN